MFAIKQKKTKFADETNRTNAFKGNLPTGQKADDGPKNN